MMPSPMWTNGSSRSGRRRPFSGSVGAAWRGVVDLALPGMCAACAAPSTASCCRGCRALFERATCEAGRHPDLPVTGPAVWWACVYDEVAADLLVAYKDSGRRDLVDVLAPPLGQAVSQAVTWTAWPGSQPPLVVPVPTTRAAVARRGDRPLEALAAAALAHVRVLPGARLVPALHVTRRVRDQSRLGRQARAANVAGAFDVDARRAGGLAGRGVVLVDDIATSGATLAEAERALRAAGVVEVRAAVVARAATRLRSA